MKKHFVFLALLLVMAACGSQSHSEKPANGGDQVPKKYHINEPWSVISKSCNGMSLKSESSEKYRLDENLFVRVEGDDTGARHCVVAYVYERLKSEASHSNTTRQERGVLQGSKAKRKCWDKTNILAAATEDVITFGPEELSYSLAGDTDHVTMVIQKGQGCATGALNLELGKVPMSNSNIR